MTLEAPGYRVKDILDQLSSDHPDRGWKTFLDAYSDLIYNVVLRYERNDLRAEDCYLHVCAKLSDKGFTRLLRFQLNGTAEFHTWLTVATANLCIDWCRSEYGRLRPFRAVRDLPEIEQVVFRYRFEHGMTLYECLHALQVQFPDQTEKQLSQANARLNATLTSEQHWRLNARKRHTFSLDELASGQGQSGADSQDPNPGPEVLVELDQERDRLEQAMNRLTPKQQLILRLRYQHNLKLKEVARLARLGDLHRARRQIQDALDALHDLLAK